MVQLERIIEQFKIETKIPSIKLTAIRSENIPVTGSKLGGKPYFPKNLEYPKNPDGVPLKLLAQLNFAELPKLENFPDKGILQFYILSNDMMGLGFDNLAEQRDFRVLYHEELLPLEMLQSDFSAFEENQDEEVIFPFDGEFILTGEMINHAMPPDDYRFNKLFNALCEKLGYEKRLGYESNYDEEFNEMVWDRFSNEYSLISGYPNFTQTDPRQYGKDLKKYDTLLFQLESQHNKQIKNWDILWGDAGVGNFFINLEDLKNCKFDDILYTWDCG